MSEWSFDPPEGIQDRETGLDALLKKIRYDITAAQGKLSEAIRMVSELDLPDTAGAPGSFVNGPVLASCCGECGCGGTHTADCTHAKETT